ncbi:ferredoxin [Brevibacillus choshinensis]|uniref:Ferredoxin n=1 Tax=Brevibacillus choshinensis TaxID=54911 RepID=A0ABR5NAS1_BRECH|nr:2Fe-2S iron-sulfur cluster-binding protein [Brevibacillus choshinensis]KQL48652.1 ferredoxin [Brevibacillus choshinensis]
MDHPDLKRCIVTVVEGSKQTSISLKDGDNLLLGLVRANMPVEFYCTTGKCTTCRLRMVISEGSAGMPSETEQYRLGADAMSLGYRLACQVYVSGPMTVYLEGSGGTPEQKP